MNRRKFTLAVGSAAAGLAAGSVFGQDKPQKEKTSKHDCKEKNDCKGQGGCSSGDNGCKGKNSCKGKGGCSMTSKD